MATPTYLELAELAVSGDFVKRCTLAVTKYATYILGESSGTDFHTSRARWAAGAIVSPSATVAQLAYAIANDGVFTSQNPLNLSTTSDANMTVAVEATINATVLKL